jgi:SAM-dependent methyltransferase
MTETLVENAYLAVDYKDLALIACPVCGSEESDPVTVRFDGGPIVRCKDCSHVFLNPSLTPEMLDDIYGRYFATLDESFMLGLIETWWQDAKGPYQFVLRWVREHGGFAGKSVCDVGCGPGRFLKQCRDEGASATGIDLSPAAVRLAKQHFDLDVLPLGIDEAIRGGTLAPGSFDMVFSFEVIEHVQQPGKFVSDLLQLVRPGGLVVLSTPNFHLFNLAGRAAQVVRNFQEHLHFFEPATLEGLVRRCGGEPIEVKTLIPVPWGDRGRQRLAASTVGAFFGRLARRSRRIRALADRLCRAMNRRGDGADRTGLSGTCLVCIARRPPQTTS